MTRTGRALREARGAVAALPLAIRLAVVLGGILGVLGGVVGLVVGLVSYAPTAWFAVVEVGVPAAFLGMVVGLLAASLVRLGHVVRR
jgi:hypothetical protein